jgi:hypothetical protein
MNVNLLIKALLLVAIGVLSLMLYPVVMSLAMMFLSLGPLLAAGLMLVALVAAIYALMKRNAKGS